MVLGRRQNPELADYLKLVKLNGEVIEIVFSGAEKIDLGRPYFFDDGAYSIYDYTYTFCHVEFYIEPSSLWFGESS